MMNLTIGQLKTFKGMEDHGFNANLYNNGTKVAEVIYGGDGGEYRYHWLNKTAEAAIEAWIATLPEIKAFDIMIKQDLSIVIGDLIEASERNKQIRGWCKKQVVFRLKGDKPNEWRTIKGLWTCGIKDALVKKHGDKLEEIANERYGGFVI